MSDLTNSEEPFDVIGLGVSVVDVVTLVDHFPAQDEVQRAQAVTVQDDGVVEATEGLDATITDDTKSAVNTDTASATNPADCR